MQPNALPDLVMHNPPPAASAGARRPPEDRPNDAFFEDALSDSEVTSEAYGTSTTPSSAEDEHLTLASENASDELEKVDAAFGTVSSDGRQRESSSNLSDLGPDVLGPGRLARDGLDALPHQAIGSSARAGAVPQATSQPVSDWRAMVQQSDTEAIAGEAAGKSPPGSPVNGMRAGDAEYGQVRLPGEVALALESNGKSSTSAEPQLDAPAATVRRSAIDVSSDGIERHSPSRLVETDRAGADFPKQSGPARLNEEAVASLQKSALNGRVAGDPPTRLSSDGNVAGPVADNELANEHIQSARIDSDGKMISRPSASELVVEQFSKAAAQQSVTGEAYLVAESEGALVVSQDVQQSGESRLNQTLERADAAQRQPMAQQVGRQLVEAVGRLVDGSIELRLNPEELGRVRMTLTPAESGMIVSLSVERAETLDMMRRNIAMLGREFAELGYTDVSFDFGASSQDGPPNGALGEQREASQSFSAAETGSDGPPNPSHATESQSPAHKAVAGLDLRV